MWPALIGAGLGGYGAYRASGGDIGATLLGAGAGALTPAGLRMAGQALGGMLGPEALSAASGRLGGAALQANLAARGMAEKGAEGVARKVALGTTSKLGGLAGKIATPVGLGGLAAGAGLALGAPQLVGGIAAAATKPVRALVGGGMTAAAGVTDPSVNYPNNPIPVFKNQYGDIELLGTNPLDPYNPASVLNTSLASQLKTAEMQQKINRMMKSDEALYREGAAKADLQRQLAYEGIRQNMQVARNLLESGVGTAQQMGLQSGQAISNILGTQFQYR